MQRDTYSASFSPDDALSATSDGPVPFRVALRVSCEVAAGAGAGAGVQVTWTWNDGISDLQDDTIISLDDLSYSTFREFIAWVGAGTTGYIQATMVPGNTGMPGYVAPQFTIEYEIMVIAA